VSPTSIGLPCLSSTLPDTISLFPNSNLEDTAACYAEVQSHEAKIWRL